MHEAESILVIIVSSVLTLFLIISIIVLVMIAKLVSAIRRVVERAESVVETASEAAEMMRNASGPLALFKVVSNILKSVEKMRK